jgi:hypothetical protein
MPIIPPLQGGMRRPVVTTGTKGGERSARRGRLPSALSLHALRKRPATFQRTPVTSHTNARSASSEREWSKTAPQLCTEATTRSLIDNQLTITRSMMMLCITAATIDSKACRTGLQAA